MIINLIDNRCAFVKMFIILNFIYCYSYSQIDTNTVIWSDRNQLTLNDFRGDSRVSMTYHGYGGEASVYITKKIITQGTNSIKLIITADFIKSQSWFNERLNDIQKTDALPHEQLHFDIAELYARKLRSVILGSKLGKNDLMKLIDVEYRNYVKKMMQEQRRYDKETNHSNNFSNQKKWKDFIHSELEYYEAFKDPTLTISF